MQLKRYYIEGIAHSSYLVGAGSEAAVVDPKRDVEDYLADAERMGLAWARTGNQMRGIAGNRIAQQEPNLEADGA
jgi:hypothetical protein